MLRRRARGFPFSPARPSSTPPAAGSRDRGLPPAHCQRTFQALVGETPKNYVARLRLERAAFRLVIHDATLLDIALDCGFQNHETFTRAFRRRFGMPPSSYRAWVRTQEHQRPETAAEQPDDAYSISQTKIRRLHPAHLAFIRHVGPYAAVPDTLFDSLEEWATNQGLAGPRIWMGIGHDTPGTTRPEHLRLRRGGSRSSSLHSKRPDRVPGVRRR